jgi:hypothetical protein
MTADLAQMHMNELAAKRGTKLTFVKRILRLRRSAAGWRRE